jgi:plastocyanin
MKNFIVSALIIVVAVAVGAFIGTNSVKLGASSGPEHLNMEYFYGGLVQGGGITTVAAGTTVTWTAADVCNSSIIKWVPTVTSAISTTTLPTAASLISRCFQKNGDFKDIIFMNAGTYASNTVAFTANTGNTVFIPEATGANQIIAGLNRALIRFTRITTSTMSVTIQEQLVQ